MLKEIKIPDTLSQNSIQWVKGCLKSYDFNESDYPTLFSAGECLDRIQEAGDAIRLHGILSTDRAGCLKPNPACAIERDNKTLFARLCRELNLYSGENDVRLPRKV